MQSTGTSIVSAGAGSIIWLVIIFASVINQIIKAGRQAKDRPRDTPPVDDSGNADPSAELQRFLQGLVRPTHTRPSVSAALPTPQQPPVMPPAARVAPRAQTRRSPPPPARRQHAPELALVPPQVKRSPRPRPSPPTPPQAFSPAPQLPPSRLGTPIADMNAEVYSLARKKCGSELRRESVICDILNPTLARKAIVLRELLGPPIALRHVPQPDYR